MFPKEVVGGVDEEFELDPEADTVEAVDPIGERREAGGVVREAAEATFDGVSFEVQRPAELAGPFQQFDRAQPAERLTAVPEA